MPDPRYKFLCSCGCYHFLTTREAEEEFCPLLEDDLGETFEREAQEYGVDGPTWDQWLEDLFYHW